MTQCKSCTCDSPMMTDAPVMKPQMTEWERKLVIHPSRRSPTAVYMHPANRATCESTAGLLHRKGQNHQAIASPRILSSIPILLQRAGRCSVAVLHLQIPSWHIGSESSTKWRCGERGVKMENTHMPSHYLQSAVVPTEGAHYMY